MLGKAFIIISVMPLYIDTLKDDLYKNIEAQIDLGNKLLNIRKGTLVLKKRNKVNYYYLSYREDGKVKTDYLGKLTKPTAKRINREIEEGLKIKNDIKELQKEEKSIRKLIKTIDRNALKKDVYEVMDLIALIRPILKDFKVKTVYLFGSYARGDANVTSDINIYCDKPNKSLREFVSKLKKETGKNVEVILIGSNISDELLNSINEESILIYGGY